MARLQTNSCQTYSSLCIYVVSCKCLPAALLRSCCTRVNITLDPVTAGVMLCSSPRRLRNLRREVVRAFQVMAASTAATLSRRVGGRQSRCAIVSRPHPRTIFRVDHALSPCPSFFMDIDYFLLVPTSSLGKNTRSIWCKKCRSIWHLSLGPPWTTEIKSSR